jgi:hypothetical protein
MLSWSWRSIKLLLLHLVGFHVYFTYIDDARSNTNQAKYNFAFQYFNETVEATAVLCRIAPKSQINVERMGRNSLTALRTAQPTLRRYKTHSYQIIFSGYPQNFVDTGRRKSGLSITSLRKVRFWLIWNSQSVSGLKRRLSTQNLKTIGRKVKVWTQFNLHPSVMYALFCANFYEIQNYSTMLHDDLLYLISSETAKNI